MTFVLGGNYMIKIEYTQVFGFEPALRDMRNPKESWDKSDSKFWGNSVYSSKKCPWGHYVNAPEYPEIGEKDLELMKSLCWGGNEHRKFLREIQIWAVIYPSRDIWQEIDTYKVATVRNSCSTMHKLGHRDLTKEDFAIQGWIDLDCAYLDNLNSMGKCYRETSGKFSKKNFDLVKAMKKRLPEGFIQRAGYHLSYETAFNMFLQRCNHRMDEWRWTGGKSRIVDGKMSICDWIYGLPYMKDLLEDSIGSIKLKTKDADILRELLDRWLYSVFGYSEEENGLIKRLRSTR